MGIFMFEFIDMFYTMKWMVLISQWPYINSLISSLFNLPVTDVHNPNFFLWFYVMSLISTLSSLSSVVLWSTMFNGTIWFPWLFPNMSKGIGNLKACFYSVINFY